MEVLRALGRRPFRAIGCAVGVWAGAWSVYYLMQEARRHWELRSRQKRYPLLERDNEADEAWFGRADANERNSIRSRFAPMRFWGRYLNVTPEWREQGIWELFWWKVVHTALYHGKFGWDGGYAQDQSTEEGRRRIEKMLPVEALDSERLWGKDVQPAAPRSGITYTWIGQSTCLVQLHGVTILTDPVFGKQPIESIFSPTRMRPMPCNPDEIRSVDVVLLSHNHFDHLDLSVIRWIPPRTRWIVPKGVAPLLERNGVATQQIKELSWWEETETALPISVRGTSGPELVNRSMKVAAVPASHWSARTPLDTNTSLWSSYAISVEAAQEKPARFFFCGDSGYSPSLFKAIGRMYGPFALAAIPIGSYEPRWHLSLQHMDPDGSVCVAQDIGARKSFATHWGTWIMSGTYSH